MMSEFENSAICHLVLETGPARVVLIGDELQPLREPLQARCECRFFATVEDCAAAEYEERSGTAVLWLGADEPAADSALGMTCRLFPERVLVKVPAGDTSMPASRFFAFGFRKLTLSHPAEAGESDLLYEYRLSEYKRPPDWLNARYWANPERFDVLEPEYDETGRPLPDEGLQGDEDDFEADADEYE